MFVKLQTFFIIFWPQKTQRRQRILSADFRDFHGLNIFDLEEQLVYNWAYNRERSYFGEFYNFRQDLPRRKVGTKKQDLTRFDIIFRHWISLIFTDYLIFWRDDGIDWMYRIKNLGPQKCAKIRKQFEIWKKENGG